MKIHPTESTDPPVLLTGGQKPISVEPRGVVGPAPKGWTATCVGGKDKLSVMKSSRLSGGTKLLAVGWFFALPLLSFGQSHFSALGNERPMGALPGDQVFPQVAVSPAGGYLVWQDNSISTNGSRIVAQRLAADFSPSGSPLVVSAASKSKATGLQEKPQVALLTNGGALFVWQGGNRGAQRICGRMVGPTGTFITGDFRVNSYAKNYQISPAVATLSDGTIVVVWASFGQDGSMLGVYGQRLSPAGGKLGPEFQVNQRTAYNQRTPAVAALASGGFVVAWVSELQRGPSSVDIYARIFGTSGPVTGEFPINLTTNNTCANPTVAGAAGGGFAVAWSQNSNMSFGTDGDVTPSQTSKSNDGWDVYGAVVDSSGNTVTAPFRINTYTYGDQYAPKLTSSGSDFLAVWTSLGQDGSWEGVFGQFFDSTGAFEGSELPVNNTTISRQMHPAVVTDRAGRFLVVWTSFVAHTHFDLFSRTYLKTTGQ